MSFLFGGKKKTPEGNEFILFRSCHLSFCLHIAELFCMCRGYEGIQERYRQVCSRNGSRSWAATKSREETYCGNEEVCKGGATNGTNISNTDMSFVGCSLVRQAVIQIKAKDLVRTRQMITKFYTMKSQMQSISLRLQTIKSTQVDLGQ